MNVEDLYLNLELLLISGSLSGCVPIAPSLTQDRNPNLWTGFGPVAKRMVTKNNPKYPLSVLQRLRMAPMTRV